MRCGHTQLKDEIACLFESCVAVNAFFEIFVYKAVDHRHCIEKIQSVLNNQDDKKETYKRNLIGLSFVDILINWCITKWLSVDEGHLILR